MSLHASPSRQVFHLHAMTEDKLFDMAATLKADVLPLALEEHPHLFNLLGRPEEVQRILSGVKATVGFVRVYPNLDAALDDYRYKQHM